MRAMHEDLPQRRLEPETTQPRQFEDEAVLKERRAPPPPGRPSRLRRMLSSPAAWVLVCSLGISSYLGHAYSPHWVIERVTLDVVQDAEGRLAYAHKGALQLLGAVRPAAEARLSETAAQRWRQRGESPPVDSEYVFEEPGGGATAAAASGGRVYSRLAAKRHFGPWSLLPALVAILLCWLTREPLSALLGGVVSGALLLGRYDLTDAVLVPSLMTKSAATVLVLYLILLGGLMGIWSRTGAAQAFADFMTRTVVRGPRTAKLVAWLLGVIFFQGGTVSTVLVGTTVKPLADKEKVSHEELSYIVDSTASPIAALIAFNAWPGYVQAFIYVAGVSFLATEADRLSFFFRSLGFSFYAIFAVLSTLLLSVDKAPVLGRRMRKAIARARSTGELDAPDSTPMSAADLHASNVPTGYRPSVLEFFLPLGLLIFVAIGTFIVDGSPQVRWAFGAAIVLAGGMALVRGMSLASLMEGFARGLKGVVFASVILILAIAIGSISQEIGGGLYLVDLLGTRIPYWLLPVTLQLLTMVIAFSTGTSWGTYAVAFPLAMPLAWAVAGAQGLSNPELFMMLCFATVLNGSLFGDQCSPISDTTILSAMCTGSDLMDHVKSQIPPALAAAGLAAICWTGIAWVFA